jgi:hypothetical protein
MPLRGWLICVSFGWMIEGSYFRMSRVSGEEGDCQCCDLRTGFLVI